MLLVSALALPTYLLLTLLPYSNIPLGKKERPPKEQERKKRREKEEEEEEEEAEVFGITGIERDQPKIKDQR